MRRLFIKTLLIHITVYLSLSIPVTPDPQTNLLNFGCSNYNATNPPLFLSNLNSTLADLRSQISAAAGGVLFATVERSRSVSPVYALAFCRAYLSRVDCLSCLSTAAARVRTCSAGTGGRVIYDGCTLRYESTPFFDQGTLPGNTPVCANGTATTMAFASAAGRLLQDLSLDTPRVDNYFVATSREGVYAAAQCTPTVSKPVCADCLQVAYQNIKRCLPASEARAVDAGCFMRYSGKVFFPASATVNLAAFEGPAGQRKGRTADVIAGVVGGICALLILGLAVFVWLRRPKRPEDRWRGDILGATELRGPVNFHYNDLKSATKNFSKENKLGEGGFGEVYKGTLKNGKVIAVKKLAMTQSKNAKASFLGEVKLISNVHHQNLLRLLGCSSKSDELLLVYEYMANGSLDKFLFGEMRGMLNWRQRFDVIVGMARGLAYLHQEFHVCIIHRDIKSSNILLDDNFRPKVADFGLARLRPGDQSHLSTYFAGTLGYIAPEYVIHGDLTEKVDTYSFGVVVLEIISGQRSSDSMLEPVPQYLLEWAWKLHDEDGLAKLIDKSLNPDEYILEEVVRVILIALLCTQVVSSRPTMSEVVVLLLSQGGPELKLARPSFIETPGRVRDEITSSTGSSSAAPTTILMPKFSAR